MRRRNIIKRSNIIFQRVLIEFEVEFALLKDVTIWQFLAENKNKQYHNVQRN